VSAPKLTLAHDATARPGDIVRVTVTSAGYVGLAVRAGGVEVTRLDLSCEEARAIARGLTSASLKAARVEKRVLRHVAVAWCRVDGRELRAGSLRCVGRIVERTDTAVCLAITPPSVFRAPRFGWPASGWFRVADGWPVDRAARRRGWRATDLADVLSAGAPR